MTVPEHLDELLGEHVQREAGDPAGERDRGDGGGRGLRRDRKVGFSVASTRAAAFLEGVVQALPHCLGNVVARQLAGEMDEGFVRLHHGLAVGAVTEMAFHDGGRGDVEGAFAVVLQKRDHFPARALAREPHHPGDVITVDELLRAAQEALNGCAVTSPSSGPTPSTR
jgi:hypothetical protein